MGKEFTFKCISDNGINDLRVTLVYVEKSQNLPYEGKYLCFDFLGQIEKLIIIKVFEVQKSKYKEILKLITKHPNISIGECVEVKNFLIFQNFLHGNIQTLEENLFKFIVLDEGLKPVKL